MTRVFLYELLYYSYTKIVAMELDRNRAVLIILIALSLAFSAWLIYDGWRASRPRDSAAELAARKAEFEEAVERGNLRLHPAEYWQEVEVEEE
ncbi:MAG: hypothetical protein GY771_12400 [bacterium]|nr:hypothetical protein [bacterium]